MLRYQFIGIALHPHLSVLDIILHCIEDFFGVGNDHDLELHVPEVDRVEGVVLPGDDDGAFVDWGADFEANAIVREEDELGGVPDAEHLWVIAVSSPNTSERKAINPFFGVKSSVFRTISIESRHNPFRGSLRRLTDRFPDLGKAETFPPCRFGSYGG